MGVLLDPPADEYERLTNVLKYHQTRLKIAVQQFDSFKEQLSMSAFPDGEGIDRLKNLQAVVGQRNEAVTIATKKLANTEEGKRRESVRKMEAENRQEQAEFLATLKDIRI